MDKAQYLLTKLMEECAEIAQRASKQIQFGKNEIQPTPAGLPAHTNSERLMFELTDLMCVCELLEKEGELLPPKGMDWEKAIEDKKVKMQKFLNYSAKLGRLPEIVL